MNSRINLAVSIHSFKPKRCRNFETCGNFFKKSKSGFCKPCIFAGASRKAWKVNRKKGLNGQNGNGYDVARPLKEDYSS